MHTPYIAVVYRHGSQELPQSSIAEGEALRQGKVTSRLGAQQAIKANKQAA